MQPWRDCSRPISHGWEEMSKALEDEAAIDRVLEGRTAPFSTIVERWQGPLVNLAYRFCRDRGRAEDMAQEAFLQAFRGLRSWRRDAAFSTWLFSVATNVYRTEMRRVRPELLPIDDNVSPSESTEYEASGDDRRKIVWTMLQSLPPIYRDPLVLFYFHDMDIAATAQSLELPRGTVKARLSRGRNLLKSKLGERL